MATAVSYLVSWIVRGGASTGVGREPRWPVFESFHFASSGGFTSTNLLTTLDITLLDARAGMHVDTWNYSMRSLSESTSRTDVSLASLSLRTAHFPRFLDPQCFLFNHWDRRRRNSFGTYTVVPEQFSVTTTPSPVKDTLPVVIWRVTASSKLIHISYTLPNMFTGDGDFSYTYDEEIQNFTESLAPAVFEFRSLSPEPVSPWYTPMDVSVRPATPPASLPQELLDINELLRSSSEEPTASESPDPYGGASSSMADSPYVQISAPVLSSPVVASRNPSITSATSGACPGLTNIGPPLNKKRTTKAPPPPRLIAAADGILSLVRMVATVSDGPSMHRGNIGECNDTIPQGRRAHSMTSSRDERDLRMMRSLS
ncbi:hypothetical protein B0H21DRAFT_835664 [Amylocystis lapponica]|nr:hypothetical protein B0H21DRAFT_835664 [Amylocystis lapponica]